MRLDQWLWAVRLFKSRTLAAEAIRTGRVTVADAPAKASHEVRSGEVIAIRWPPIVRTFDVLGAPRSRVGAGLVPEYMRETTPADALERLRTEQKELARLPADLRGRPTKRLRREWLALRGKE